SLRAKAVLVAVTTMRPGAASAGIHSPDALVATTIVRRRPSSGRNHPANSLADTSGPVTLKRAPSPADPCPMRMIETTSPSLLVRPSSATACERDSRVARPSASVMADEPDRTRVLAPVALAASRMARAEALKLSAKRGSPGAPVTMRTWAEGTDWAWARGAPPKYHDTASPTPTHHQFRATSNGITRHPLATLLM